MIENAIPIIWLAIATFGLALAGYSLIESVTDYNVTKPSNGFRALALSDIAMESLRVGLYLLFAGIGIYYLANPSIEIARPGVAIVMVLAELIIVAKTMIQLIVRRYLRVTHGRTLGVPETQNQKEDREFGEARRELEITHTEDTRYDTADH